MITALKKVLVQDLDLSEPVEVIKYSTPISGTGIGTKVIFFAFLHKESYPRYVAKTVRSLRDVVVITKAFNNLKKINTVTKGSVFYEMFPVAQHLTSLEEVPVSIETVCAGKKIDKNSLTDFDGVYTQFSKYLLDHQDYKNKNINLDITYGLNLIEQLEGKAEDILIFKNYIQSLWHTYRVDLPLLPQHGDVTIDNILRKGKDFCLVDCDLFGEIGIPGFDMYHLWSRNSPGQVVDKVKSYFKELGIDYVPDKKLLFIYFLHELVIKKDYILKKKPAEAIIADFENMVAS